MNLNNNQKEYIKKNIHKVSIDTISKDLNIENIYIKDYIKTKFGSAKLQRIMNKNNEESLKTQPIISPKKKFIPLIFLTVITLIAYGPFLGNQFVSDDIPSILQNNNIGNFNYAIDNPFGMIRPLLYFIAYHLGGSDPFFYRLINLSFHLGSVFLIYFILNKLYKSSIAFFTAGLFAVHPVLTEGVIWISGGGYSQAAFFLLLSFLFYINNGIKNFLISIISFTLALESQATPLILVPILFLYELVYGDLKANFKKLIPFLILSLGLILISIQGISQRQQTLETMHYEQAGADNPLIVLPVAISNYLSLIIWPQGLTLYHSEMYFSQVQYYLMTFILLGLLCSLVYFYKKNKDIFFWISFFIISLAPTIVPAIFRLTWIVAERYVYLGSLGIIFLIAFLIKKIGEISKQKEYSLLLFYFLILILIIRTIFRNNDWKDADTLWLATAPYSPSSPNIHNNLGDLYGRRGDLARSINEFKTAIQIKPNYGDAYHNLGNAYSNGGDYENAILSYKKAMELNPKLWQSYTNLASIYLNQKKYPDTINILKNGIQNNPKNINLKIALGITFLQSGDKDNAKNHFLEVLKIDPQNSQAKLGLTESLK